MKSFLNLARALWQRTDSEEAAALRLASAYTSVFLGNPSQEDQNLVLMDLADYSGFYRVDPPGATDPNYSNGMRAVYGRVFRFLRMGDDERQLLEKAARESAVLRDQLAQGKTLE